MTYHCPHCKFTWNFWGNDFHKVLDHERTHEKPARQSDFDDTDLMITEEVR